VIYVCITCDIRVIHVWLHYGLHLVLHRFFVGAILKLVKQPKNNRTRQTNCMTRMISRDYHFRYHSAYYIVYHRFLPKTYSKLFSVEGCCFCCCCFQCNFPYLIVVIRAWFAGKTTKLAFVFYCCLWFLCVFFIA
jgi:hypothetical protein